MKKKLSNGSALLEDNLFRSLLECDAQAAEDSAEANDRLFDSVFADDIGFDYVIKDLDPEVSEDIIAHMSDPKDVKIVVKTDEDNDETNAFVAVEEFANFCKYSKLDVVDAINKLCYFASEEVGEEITFDNFNIIIDKGVDKDAYNGKFISHLLSNGINVAKLCKSESKLED